MTGGSVVNFTRSQQSLVSQIEDQRRHIEEKLAKTQAYVQQLQQGIQDLPQQVNLLRQKGHPYDPELEEGVSLQKRWNAEWPLIQAGFEEGLSRLQLECRQISQSVSLSNWLTELQVTQALESQLKQFLSLETRTDQWQTRLLSQLKSLIQMYRPLAEITNTCLNAHQFLQEATFLIQPGEVPLGAFTLNAVHWGPTEHLPVYVFISDQRLVLEVQYLDPKRNWFGLGETEMGRERKVLQQWPIEALTQVQRHTLPASKKAAPGPICEAVSLFFDETHLDVIVEQLSVYPQTTQELELLLSTLERAQHPRRIPVIQQEAMSDRQRHEFSGWSSQNVPKAIQWKLLTEMKDLSPATYQELSQLGITHLGSTTF
jgi:hypothetical protein